MTEQAYNFDGIKRGLRTQTGRIVRHATVVNGDTKRDTYKTDRGMFAVRRRAASAIRRRARIRTQKKGEVAQEKPKKKMTGIGFWAMVMIAAIKDLLDLALNITIILSILVIFIGLVVTCIIMLYYFAIGVKFTTKKLATIAITGMMEIMPFLSIFPVTVFSLFIVRTLEHK